MQHVLVTGAAGGIGTRLRKLLKGVYPRIRWSDIKRPDDLAADEEFVQADISRLRRGRETHQGHRRHRASRRPFDRRAVGDHPLRQHHRLPQHVRGGVPQRRQARRVRLIEPRGRLLSARQEDRRRRHGAPGLALWREQGVRRGDRRALCRQARPARHVPAHRQFRRRPARQAPPLDLAQAGRPRAAHPHRARASRHQVRDLLRRVRQCARRGGTIPTRASSATSRPARPRISARRRWKRRRRLPPDPVGERYQGGPFCSDEYDADKRG